MRRVLTVAGPFDSRSASSSMVGKAAVDLREKVAMVVERGQHGEVAGEAGNYGGNGDGVEGEGAVVEMAMAGEIRRLEDGGNTTVGKVGLTRPSHPRTCRRQSRRHAASPRLPRARRVLQKGREKSCQPRHPLLPRAPLPSLASPTAPLLPLGRLVAVHEGREGGGGGVAGEGAGAEHPAVELEVLAVEGTTCGGTAPRAQPVSICRCQNGELSRHAATTSVVALDPHES